MPCIPPIHTITMKPTSILLAALLALSRPAWAQTVPPVRLAPSTINADQNYGYAVDLDGDVAVVGVSGDGHGRTFNTGAAFVYRFDGAGWNFHSKLFASDGQGFKLFGSSVALSGNRLLVGADNWFPDSGNSTGKAYLFEYDETADEWVETEGLLPAELTQGAGFGHAAAIQGEVILIGAPEFDGDENDSDAAFIYGQPMVVTSVDDGLPAGTFRVSKPYPNPSRGMASITITPGRDGPVRVALYNVLGRKVKTLFVGRLPANATTMTLEAGDLPNGLYWIRARTSEGVISRPITIIR